jgi:hypothetical protein
LKVVLTVSEQVEGSYGDTTVAEQEFRVPLPASARDVADAVGIAVTSMNDQVIRFRGKVRDVKDTAKIEVDAEPTEI